MRYLTIILYLLIFTSCASVAVPTAQEELEQAIITQKIEQRDLRVNVTWAYPQGDNVINQLSINNGLGLGNTTGRIQLEGSGSYLAITKDSVRAYIPYYGERRIVSGLNVTNAIEFSGVPDTYELDYNEKKKRSEISFTVDGGNEQYDVQVEIFNSNRVRIAVNSTHRVFIRYDGTLAIDDLE